MILVKTCYRLITTVYGEPTFHTVFFRASRLLSELLVIQELSRQVYAARAWIAEDRIRHAKMTSHHTTESSRNDELHQGDRLDHYQIGSLVARSGMASIFRATDTRNGQPVAIKLPPEEMASGLVLHALSLRESAIGQSLYPPGRVNVHGVTVPGRFHAV